MPVQTLDAALVITGKDGGAGRAIDAVAGKLDKLALAGKRIDGVGRGFSHLGDGIDRANRKLDAMHSRMQRIHNLGSRLQKSVGPLAEAYLGSHFTAALTAKAARAAVENVHEQVRMEAAGMTPAEIKEAEEVAGRLSGEFKGVSQTTILHLLRNARSIVGDFDEAAKIIAPLLKTYVVAKSAHPERGEELEADFDKLVKGMEIKGVTQDMAKFTHYLDGMAKALNVFGDTLRPTDYYEMFKYGRQATQSLSDEFMLMVAPTLAQELGGTGAGKALSSFFQTIVGGKMKASAANELLKYDLLDRSKIKISKAGIVTHVDPGAVLGADIASASPYRWVNEVFLPALAKKGVTDPQKIQQLIAIMFQQGTAAQLTSIFATQQARIEKDKHLVEGAQGAEAYKLFQAKDPATAWHGVTEQFTNLLQVTASPLVPKAVAGMNALAASLAGLTAAASHHAPAASGLLSMGVTAAGGMTATVAGKLLKLPWLARLGMGLGRFVPAVGGGIWALGILSEIERLKASGHGDDWEWHAGVHNRDWENSAGGYWGDVRLPHSTAGARDRVEAAARYHAYEEGVNRGASLGGVALRGRVDISLNTDLFDARVRKVVVETAGIRSGLGASMDEVYGP